MDSEYWIARPWRYGHAELLSWAIGRRPGASRAGGWPRFDLEHFVPLVAAELALACGEVI